MYDKDNIFAKIIRGDLPCNKIYEDELVFSFYDIHPKAKVHALVVPKLEVVNFTDFTLKSTPNQISDFFTKSSYIANNILKLASFKILTNNGKESGQEVFHFHIHILS